MGPSKIKDKLLKLPESRSDEGNYEDPLRLLVNNIEGKIFLTLLRHLEKQTAKRS